MIGWNKVCICLIMNKDLSFVSNAWIGEFGLVGNDGNTGLIDGF